MAAAAACGGDDPVTGGGDASTDTSPPLDAATDTTTNDVTPPPDANDSAVTDAASDTATGSDADAGSDSAADSGADADSATDAGADADSGPDSSLPCSTIPNVGSIYYSRYPIPLPDGGPKTDGELWVVKGDGSTDVKLGAGRRPRLSPDGKRLMFLRDNANVIAGNLYVRDLPTDGGAPVDTLVFANDNSVVGYDWRSDSQSIVFDYKCDIYSANADGTNRVVFSSYRDADCYSDYPVVNRVDGRVAFHNFYDGLDLASGVDGGAAKIPNTFAGSDLPPGPIHTEADMSPSWTADGQWIAFLKVPPQDIYTPGMMGPAWKLKPDGTGLALVFNFDPGDGFFHGGAMTPDGVYYVSAGIYKGVNGIYAVPFDGSGAIKRVCTSAGPLVDFVGSVTGP